MLIVTIALACAHEDEWNRQMLVLLAKQLNPGAPVTDT